MPPPPLAITAPGGITVKNIPSIDRTPLHPEYGLEPAQVISIYRAAECGWTCNQADLFEGIVERDGHLQACILGRINAVAGKSWQVMPGGADAQSVAAAELLDATLKATNFGEMISHWLSARYMGWSGSEIVWENLDGLIAPTWFIDVPARRFSFDSADRPELVNQTSHDREALESGKWIFVRNRGPFSGLTSRSGLLRGGAWMSLFKSWSWRDWVIYAEKFGIPLVVGKYKQGATEVEKQNLEEAVEDIGEAGQATMSEETNIEINEAQRGGDSNGLHRSIVREANEEISKLITGSTLTMASGGNGSFAQAEVHANTSFAHVEADAALIAANVQLQLFKSFLKWNGFTSAKTPRLVIHITKETDGLTRIKEAEGLVAMGLELDSEQLREETGFRAPPTPDRVLGGRTQSEPATSVEIGTNDDDDQ
jgi:phage gp29-like protein